MTDDEKRRLKNIALAIDKARSFDEICDLWDNATIGHRDFAERCGRVIAFFRAAQQP